jgi:peptidoglycan-associated lipoprotein
MHKSLITLVAALALAACASKDVKEEPGAKVEERAPSMTETRPVEPVQPPPVTTTTKPIMQEPLSGNPLKDPKSILSKRSIYYDYDSNIVKDEYKPLVTAHSKYLTDHRAVKATIQGNTDERGSREYNLALGQRRADAVKQMMLLLGVSDAQLESVSFGEEKPRGTGHDEASFAENRRSDIVYQGE